MPKSTPIRWRQSLLLAVVVVALGGLATFVQAGTTRTNPPLDSRTIPHPDWVQISGQIEQTAVVSARNGDQLWAILRPSEGSRMPIDLGPAHGKGSFQPKRNDFIQVRGRAIEREGQVTIIAKEVFAKGKLFSIHRTDEESADAGYQVATSTGE